MQRRLRSVLTRCLDKCLAMSMTCCCPSLPAHEATGCSPSSGSKPRNALPKLCSPFRKRGERLEAPLAPLPHCYFGIEAPLAERSVRSFSTFCLHRALRSAGDSEDNVGKGSPTAAASPPIVAAPLSAVAPGAKFPPTLEYMLEICPRGNHISLYSWLIKCTFNIHG